MVFYLRFLVEIVLERQMKYHGENTVPTYHIPPTVELELHTAGVAFIVRLLNTRVLKLIIKTGFLQSKRALYVTSHQKIICDHGVYKGINLA